MVAARIDDAERIAEFAEVEIDLFDLRCGWVGKVHRRKAADAHRHLVEQTGRLAEVDVLRVFGNLRRLDRGDRIIVVEVGQDRHDEHLERRGARKPGALEHARGRHGVKPADLVAERGKARADAADQRGGPLLFLFLHGEVRRIDRIHRITGGFQADHAVVGLFHCGDHIEVDRGGQHLAVVVVGVVAADLGAARRAEIFERIRRAEFLGKGRIQSGIARALCLRFRAVKRLKVLNHRISPFFRPGRPGTHFLNILTLCTFEWMNGRNFSSSSAGISSLRKTIDLPLSKYMMKRLRLSHTPIMCS